MKIAVDQIWNPFTPDHIDFLFNFEYTLVQNINVADVIFQALENYPVKRTKEKQFLIKISGEPNNTIDNHYDLNLGNNEDSEKTLYCPYFMFNLYSKQNSPLRINLLLERPISIMSEKTKFCLFINSNPTKERIDFVNELQKYKHVDCLGKVLNNGEKLTHHFGSSEFLEFINQYKFMVCFENSNISGYGSEKPINAYAGGSIPIYWGSQEIYNLINKNAFIINEDITKTIEEIKYLDNDDQAYFNKWSQPFFLNNIIPEKLQLKQLQDKIYSRIKKKID